MSTLNGYVVTAWGNRKGDANTDDPYAGMGGQYGYYTDYETGYILCTNRYYDPAGGRWLTRDPIEYSGGMNLYGYVANNPVNAVDPSGLVLVEIHSRNVSGPFGIALSGDHTFILVWDTDSRGKKLPNQTPYMFAGYNHPGNVGTPADKYLHARGGSLSNQFDDFSYLPGGKDSGYYMGVKWSMYDPNKCAAQVFKSLGRVKDSLNKAKWKYALLGKGNPNSNTAVYTMINDGLGLKPKLDMSDGQFRPGFNSIREYSK